MARLRDLRRDLAALLGVVVTLPLAAVACDQQSAIGKHNTTIVVSASDSLWRAVEDTTYGALEPTFFTTRVEKQFYVEQVDTAVTEEIVHLLGFKRVVVFGTPDNRYVREVVDAAEASMPEPPGVVFARDVWARDQWAAAVVLSPDRQPDAWRDQLPEVAAWVDSTYRSFVVNRMYVSGSDTVAMDSIARRFRFGIAFPRVYDVAVRGEGEGPVVIRNDNPDPSELIRSVLVDWRSPPMDTLTVDAAVAWRRAVDSLHYGTPQAIDTVHRSERVEVDGRPALEVLGIWSDEGTSYPAAGPFVLRLVQCPERTYLHDAWIYAPGKDRYEYDIQVRRILDSFTCEPPNRGSSP